MRVLDFLKLKANLSFNCFLGIEKQKLKKKQAS